jgi:hypothetical protein
MGIRSGGRDFRKIIHHYEPFIDGKRHKVAVKMESTSKGEIRFFTDHFKDEENRPIEKVFKKLPDLYEYIEEQLATLPDVVWESKIYIEVKGRSDGQIDGTKYHGGEQLLHSEVEVTAMACEIGTGTDGKMWRRAPGERKRVEKFDKNIGYGLEKEKYYWKTDDPNDPGEPYSRALIDDTVKNRELLVQFSVKFDELRDQFFKAFAPEHVERFLSQTAGTLLLNSGEATDSPKRSDTQADISPNET